jgi:hypothetical protein
MDMLASSILAISCIIGGIVKPEVSGTWSLEVQWPGLTNAATCTFAREGERLSGTCGTGEDLYALTGLARGHTLSWQVDGARDVTQAPMYCSGEMHEWGARIVGTCRVGDEFGSFMMEQHARAPGRD